MTLLIRAPDQLHSRDVMCAKNRHNHFQEPASSRPGSFVNIAVIKKPDSPAGARPGHPNCGRRLVEGTWPCKGWKRLFSPVQKRLFPMPFPEGAGPVAAQSATEQSTCAALPERRKSRGARDFFGTAPRRTTILVVGPACSARDRTHGKSESGPPGVFHRGGPPARYASWSSCDWPRKSRAGRPEFEMSRSSTPRCGEARTRTQKWRGC